MTTASKTALGEGGQECIWKRGGYTWTGMREATGGGWIDEGEERMSEGGKMTTQLF